MTDAVLLASRALVAVAARSIAAVDDSVTLQQFRALVVLDRARARVTVGQLADALDIQPSTTTRLCDRLVAKQLIRREVGAENRRQVAVELTPAGRDLVDGVTAQRRREISSILSAVRPGQQAMIVDALTAFSEAAGERPSELGVPW